MNADHEKRVEMISRQALKAVVDLEEVKLSPLSPLAVMEPSAGPVAAEEMAAWLEGLSGAWEWVAPALIDPQRTMALLYAGQSHGQVGQYVFPDRDGVGPAFSAGWTGEALEVRGPWSAGELRLALLEPFSLDFIAETPLARLDLSRRQFWALAAFVDAHRVSRLARSLVRRGGLPEGVSVSEVAEAWRNGVSIQDPEWAVSMLSLLLPDGLPKGFEQEVPGVLAEMAAVGLLQKVDIGGAGTDCYAPRGDVEGLCLELSESGAVFGLALRLLKSDGRPETGTLLGWRTAGGIWLVDLGGADGGEAVILRVGPYLFMEFVAGLLPEEQKEATTAAFSMETTCSRDALVSRLRAMPESAEPGTAGGEIVPKAKVLVARAFCTACGQPLKEGASFCTACGKPVGGLPPRQVFCTACGKPLKEGMSFCPGCGKPV